MYFSRFFSYFDELETGFSLFLTVRSSKRKYELAWLSAHACASGIILSGAYALFSLAIWIMQPSIYDSGDEMVIYLQDTLSSDFFWYRLCGLFIFGVLIAVSSMILSKIIKNKQIVLTLIFSTVYMYSVVIFAVQRKYSNIGNYDMVRIISNALPEYLMNIFVCSDIIKIIYASILLLLIAIYYIMISRKKI